MADNARVWQHKPLLRRIYRDLHQRLLPGLAEAKAGMTLECGSGLGAIKETIPWCVTTDLEPTPWADRVENAYRLSCPDAGLDNLILFDVFHHLQYPAAFIAEARRALRPGGRLHLLEPGMGLLPRLIYGCFHREPLGWKSPLCWDLPAREALLSPPYYAAQANAWRIFCGRNGCDPILVDWTVAAVHRISSFAYLASGGFSGPQLYPTWLYPALRGMDRLGNLLPGLCAGRLLVVLERKD